MTVSDVQPPQSYSQEEVQQILQLAIARQAMQGELTRQQLWEIASELDIEPSTLQLAEADWLRQKSLAGQRHAFNTFRRHQLQQKAIKFAIANSFLGALNYVSAGTLSWSLYIVLLWGLGLTLDAWKTWQTQGDAYEKAFQRWQFNHEVRRSFSALWQRLQKTWQTGIAK